MTTDTQRRIGLRARLNPTRRLQDGLLGRFLADASRPLRSIRALRRSGLFDTDWYLSQLAPEEHPRDPISHYVRRGAALGLSPHPLFDPEFYLDHRTLVQPSAAVPFLEYLDRGCHRGDDPHPLFSTETYLQAAPKAARHRYGAFGHFIETSNASWPNGDVLELMAECPTGRDDYIDLVERARQTHQSVEDYTSFPRSFEEFDHASAHQFVQDMREVVARMDRPRTVTVVLPTKDRRDPVIEAIQSVQAQTYPHWELVVVDDGGTDGTDVAVAELANDDPRIQYVHQDNTGVAGARNRGIRETTGELIAYLDSDNTWEPAFLKTMVGFLRERGLRAGYAASELRRDDYAEYRGQPLHVPALRERNYVDCITVVHERSLIDDLGGYVFDERLRRVVDWDLLIRLAEVTDLDYAPFIATRYDVWDETGDRITNTESPGYRQVVRDKHMVGWSEAPEPVPGRVSVVIVVRSPGSREVPRAITTMSDLLAEESMDLEILVVDNGLAPGHALRLRVVEQLVDAVTVTRVPDPASTVVARNLAASMATGDVLIMLDPGVRAKPEAVRSLVNAVRSDGPVLAQPLILGADARVHSTGQLFGPRASQITVGHGLAMDDPALTSMTDRDGVDGMAFAVDSGTYRSLGGMDPLFTRGAADLDVGLRARSDHGVPTTSVPGAVVELSFPEDAGRWSPTNSDRIEFARRWREHPPRDLVCLENDAATIDALEPMPGEASGLPKRWTVQLRPRPTRRRWAIKTSVPNAEVRETWGDWHFAGALRDALVELGEDAVVDCAPAWYRPSAQYDDVNLVLRGTQRFEPHPDKLNLLWVISHPELLTRFELEQYDDVFVASLTYPDQLRRRWPGLSATPLLQCTDARRFHPDPDPALHEDLLFVGNSRNVLRTAVRDALEAGLEPTVYGSRWEDLIPAKLVKGTHVPNDALRRHYASASVVLNDHWDDMREHGFLSNRLFDAVASGARVVTDRVAGLDGIFGDRVVSYAGGPAALVTAIDEARSRPIANPDVVATIAREHTFLARARLLVEAVNRLEHATRPRSRVVVATSGANRGLSTEPATAPVEVLASNGDVRPRYAPTNAATETVQHDSVSMNAEVPPVFVGGTGRSGTTIVGNMIAASHRYAMIPVEIRLHTDPRGLVDLVAGRISVDEFEENVWERWYLRPPNNSGPRGLHVVASRTQVKRALDELRGGIEVDAEKAAGRFLRALLDPLAEAEGAQSWVEMTPPSAKAAGTLARALPEAKFVNMVRDGRDVATSVLQRRWGPDTMQEALTWWADGMIAIARSTAHLGDRQVLHMRLESLVGPDREAAFAQLVGFLGLHGDAHVRGFFDENLSSKRAREGRWERGRPAEEIADIERWYEAALERLASEGVAVPAV